MDFKDLRTLIDVYGTKYGSTYSYVKHRPRYVLGYSSGSVQIIKGRIIYGGIRDLNSYCFSIPPKDLNSYIGGHSPSNLPGIIIGDKPSGYHDIYSSAGGHLPVDLSSYLGTHQPRDIFWYIVGLGHSPSDISSYISTHLPANLSSSILGYMTSGYHDVYSSVGGHLPVDLSSYLDTHQPRNLFWYVIGLKEMLRVDLSGSISTHEPENLNFFLFTEQRDIRFLPSSLNIWHMKDLPSYLNTVLTDDVASYLNPILPRDLSAYLKARCVDIITFLIHGYGYKDLYFEINQIYSKNLFSYLNPISDITSDLISRIIGIGSGYKDFVSFIGGVELSNLGLTINSVCYNDLPFYLFSIIPRDFSSSIHGWDTSDLSSYLNSTVYPWDLGSSINPVGFMSDIKSFIAPKMNTNLERTIGSQINSWDISNLFGSIYPVGSVDLGAYLNTLGHSSSLSSSIYPKTIRLTAIVGVSTLSHSDISSVINYLCFNTGYSVLRSYINSVYKYDLTSSIMPIYYNSSQQDIVAKVGYTDTVSMVDKLNINISILPSKFISEDKFKLNIRTFAGAYFLTSSIRGTLSYSDFSSSIEGRELSGYVYEKPLQNFERAVNTNYAGILESYEIVEMKLKDMVKEYYYSSDGDYAWKKDRFERWVLGVKSVLPADSALRLKRRIHKSTQVYDLRKFESIDEAVRFAIDYVICYPENDIGSTLNCVGTYVNLNSSITPRFIVTSLGNLNSSINPIDVGVYISYGNNVEKI